MALWDNAACMELDRFLDARGIRHSIPTLGTTLGDPLGHGHTAGSNHYRERDGGPRGSTGQARDYGDRSSDCIAIAEAFLPYAVGPNYVISELIYTRRLPRTGYYFKRGVAYTPSFALAWQHRDHDHVAIAVGRHLPGAPHPTPQPTPHPTPVPPLQEDEMLYIVHAVGDNSGALYLTNGLKRRWLQDKAELDHWLMEVPHHKVEEWPFNVVARMPFEGQTP